MRVEIRSCYFAYNGMEVDNEVKGNGNSYTTEFRQYDPRLGRWLSLDPLMSSFPWMSPYVAFDNNPVYYIDPYGLESGIKDDNGRGPAQDDNGSPRETGRQKADGSFDGHQKVKEVTASAKARIIDGAKKPEKLNIPLSFANDNKKNIPKPLKNPNLDLLVNGSTTSKDTKPSEYLTKNHPLPLEKKDIIKDNNKSFLQEHNAEIGVAIGIKGEMTFSKKFNTWQGKDGKIRSQDWGGNKTTGGKNKYAKTSAKYFKFLGAVSSGYSYYSTNDDWKSGNISTTKMVVEQSSNTIGIVPLFGTAWSIGWEAGKSFWPWLLNK